MRTIIDFDISKNKANAAVVQDVEEFQFATDVLGLRDLKQIIVALGGNAEIVFEYQADSWDTARRVIVLNDEHGGTQFIATNLNFPQRDVVNIYRKHATIEDIIRELKVGFSFGKTDSSTFIANESRMWISVIAANLMR